MASSFYHLVVDSIEPETVARFWSAVLDQPILYLSDNGDEAIVGVDEQTYPGLCFLRDPNRKTVKNRLHIDLNPDDQDAEVDRVLALGARRVDIGQSSDVSWVVLADPEGNEFCVLRRHGSLID
ncbi:VOC family protein [Actinomadura rubrisoli]|uniref:VOC family protein n=1 Tax=Actinomadura rubrisoli TaxID=2530368 RepID=A0A4R5AT85_9ACTN|nr:VOC family protein [Actinomadura rubrisoli]TDD74314.1 VOC family protein [Actinomadura rubrisoli]